MRHMVGRWGMSDAIGMVAVLPRDAAIPGRTHFAEDARAARPEVRETIDRAYGGRRGAARARAVETRCARRSAARTETLDQIDAYHIVGLAEPEVLPVD